MQPCQTQRLDSENPDPRPPPGTGTGGPFPNCGALSEAPSVLLSQNAATAKDADGGRGRAPAGAGKPCLWLPKDPSSPGISQPRPPAPPPSFSSLIFTRVNAAYFVHCLKKQSKDRKGEGAKQGRGHLRRRTRKPPRSLRTKGARPSSASASPSPLDTRGTSITGAAGWGKGLERTPPTPS